MTVLCIPPEQRFWPKVVKTDSCWLWLGGISGSGYGIFAAERTPEGPSRYRQVPAHRYAYELLVGPVPPGLHLDHLCRNRHCVNPAHLEPVTPRENTLRGVGPSAKNAVKTHCKHGHELTPENTRINPKTGQRACKECSRATYRRWHARNLERERQRTRDARARRRQQTTTNPTEEPPQTLGIFEGSVAIPTDSVGFAPLPVTDGDG